MDDDLNRLIPLLRVELSAVHQQFFHMLALRQWKERELLNRITNIDREDFQNAMQIIDLMASRRQPVNLSPHRISPGSNIPAILAAELSMEDRIADVLATLQVVEPAARARVERAAAPRQAYRDWLAEQAAASEPPGQAPETGPAMAAFTAELIALVEQAMLHAFLLWYQGDRAGADNAWRLSGAAMLYGTALVRLAAPSHALSTPSLIPAVRMAERPEDAFHDDIALTNRCAELGRAAAEAERNGTMRSLCLRIADDCDLIATMTKGQEFPAVFGRSPVFESFAATRERHLD